MCSGSAATTSATVSLRRDEGWATVKAHHTIFPGSRGATPHASANSPTRNNPRPDSASGAAPRNARLPDPAVVDLHLEAAVQAWRAFTAFAATR